MTQKETSHLPQPSIFRCKLSVSGRVNLPNFGGIPMEFFFPIQFLQQKSISSSKIVGGRRLSPSFLGTNNSTKKKNFDVSATFDQQIHSNIFHTLRIMRSQVTGCLEMFGDPKPLLDTSKPFFFAGLPVILRVDM